MLGPNTMRRTEAMLEILTGQGLPVGEASGRYPILSEWMAHPRIASPTEQFELSLNFLLDGIASQLRRHKHEKRDTRGNP